VVLPIRTVIWRAGSVIDQLKRAGLRADERQEKIDIRSGTQPKVLMPSSGIGSSEARCLRTAPAAIRGAPVEAFIASAQEETRLEAIGCQRSATGRTEYQLKADSRS
jgi:hypothetical protein